MNLLIVIVLLISLSIVLFILTDNNKLPQENSSISKEYYSRVFPPLNMPYFIKYFKVVTPLRPLISPLKSFPIVNLPSIFRFKPRLFSPVRDQANCGSCYAFVICSQMSDNITVKLTQFGRNLNVENLISCYPSASKCSGEAPENVLIWIQQTQFKLNINDEYNYGNSTCALIDKGFTIKKGSVFALTEYIQRESIMKKTQKESDIINRNIKRMKSQLITKGPFIATITVYEDLFGFDGRGVYINKVKKPAGGHAITVSGYCNEGVDTRTGYHYGYWICKNTWGTNWAARGDTPGFFYIRMGVNECGIESRCSVCSVNVEYSLQNKAISRLLYEDNYAEYIKDVNESINTRRFQAL